jgi:leucine dehydrogenase
MASSPSLFALLEEFRPEEFHVVHRRDLGLTAFIAIDDTRLGPATGGIRWRAYPTPEDGAADVLRLARAMTYKNAFAELDLGGGKTVVLRDPATRREAAFPALGEAIEALGGRYITACDYGTTVAELALVKSRTRFALAEDAAGDLDLGTATGVLVAIRAVWRRCSGRDTLDGVRVLVQGVGDVGLVLARLLVEAGARVSFSEIDDDRAARCAGDLAITRVPAAAIFDADVDVLAPCAVGEVITEDAARRLRARGIAGAANNQLASESAGAVLQQRDIWYAPDFAANAGAVIVGFETFAGRAAQALDAVRRIEGRLDGVFEDAARDDVTTTAAAVRRARNRLDMVGRGRARG